MAKACSGRFVDRGAGRLQLEEETVQTRGGDKPPAEADRSDRGPFETRPAQSTRFPLHHAQIYANTKIPGQ